MEISRYIPETDRVKTTEKLRVLQDPQIEKTPQILFEVHADVAETNRVENYAHSNPDGMMRTDVSLLGAYYHVDEEEGLTYSEQVDVTPSKNEWHNYVFDEQPDGSYTAYERSNEIMIPREIPIENYHALVVNLFNAFTAGSQELGQTPPPMAIQRPTHGDPLAQRGFYQP